MKRERVFRLALVGGCSALALGISLPALAADNGQLEEIVVTAQKRSENLQKVPISISTISTKALAATGALKTDELSVAIPGLSVEHEINEVTTFIRGIGPSSNGSGEESSVVVYLDDIYIPSGNGAVFDLNGVSGVEVQKGPQGTLFGRNATGGVIQVKTKDPTFTPEIDAHIGYGNYDTKSGDLYVSGTIIPGKLAANLAIYGSDESAGWGHDIITGQKTFTSTEDGVRAKLLFTPTDSTKIKLSFGNMYERGETGLGQVLIPGTAAPALPDTATFPGWYNTEDVPINDESSNWHQVGELRIDQTTPYAKLVSITGWQHMEGHAQYDQDGSPAGVVQTRLNQFSRDFSQELQVLNPDDAPYASWLTWIAGGYFMREVAGYHDATIVEPFALPPGGYVLLNDWVSTTSWAEYAQATAKILPDTHVTIGARETIDRKLFGGGETLEPAIYSPFLNTNWTGTPGAGAHWNMQTYRFALDRQVTKNILAYFSYNRGVKSGQFDTFGTAGAGPLAAPPVQPEIVHAFELGVKTELFDHRVRLNAALFRNDVTNLQFEVSAEGATKLINAAGAQINGIDIDATAKVIRHLTLSGGMVAQYGFYTSFPNAPAYLSPPTYEINATKSQTIRTPKFTTHLAADYIFEEPFGDFDANVNWTRTSKFQWEPDGSLPQATTNIFNASLLWTAPKGNFDVRLWGSNITGEKYYTFGTESLGLGSEFSPASPATYGVTLGYHFS